jgi:hypothetical protein
MFFAALVISFSFTAQAQTTVVDTELGGTFTGDIAASGSSVVQGRFNAAGGETITLTVQADRGTDLVPGALIRQLNGIPVSGSSRSISWLGVGNVTHVFSVPSAGVYLAEITGLSGSGRFTATLSGTAVAPMLVTVAGNVTDSATGSPIVGATVTADGGAFDTTDAAGDYSGQLDPGTYDFQFDAAGYVSQNQTVDVVAGMSIGDLDAALDPVAPPGVTLEITVSGTEAPGGAISATVEVLPAGTVVNGYTWTKTVGPPIVLTGADTATVSTTLPDLEGYKENLIHHLEEPPVTADQLPPNVPLPPGEFPAGLQDRLQVVGINPFALEEAAVITLEVEVDTGQGFYTAHTEVHVSLPWAVSAGIRNVPQRVPVLVRAKDHGSYDWTLAGPPGSIAALQDASTRHPYFTPDVPGLYELTLADVPSGSDTLEVYVGTWRGVIVDQDINGRPVSDTACTFCHNGVLAADTFTDWAETGHAEIFSDLIDTSTHYGERCFSCHTVGFGPDAVNGSLDEASDYQAFLDSGLINTPGDNWTTILEQFPETARLANIQCENCHGPQNSFAHGIAGPIGEPRVGISSDVCATCHGEPQRHARFQQWQLSGHANYEVAMDEVGNGSCARCHTGNGFLDWLPVLLDDDPATDPLEDIYVCGPSDTCIGGPNDGKACADDDECPAWSPDEAHPQTCVTCHDPHNAGTTSGSGTNATVRISGDTPPLIAGFTATDVGRGAICITCHNSRRGARNDSVWDAFSTSEKVRAPHGSAQGDMLMGQNAYFVAVDEPGGHAMVEDSCVGCHMESTPPPDVLSYNSGGSNHTFYADRYICSDCHSATLDPDDVQGAIGHSLGIVEDLLEAGWFEVIEAVTDAGDSVDLNGDRLISDASEIAEIQFTEARGRQALEVTFNDNSVFGPYRLTDIDVRGAGNNVIGALGDYAPDDLMKAGWNWALVENDGSHGVHNPFFASGILIAARDALLALQPAGAVRGPEMFAPVWSGEEFRRNKPLESRRVRER